MKVYDISRTLAPGMAVWPGDQPFERDWTQRISGGSLANVGRVRLSLHTGTHVDAPFHFKEDGQRMDEVDLAVHVGEALVVDIGAAGRIAPEHIASLNDIPPRVLFRTSHSANPDDRWNPGYPHVVPELADALADRGVVLLGTDAPSVDPAHSEDLAAHHALADRGVFILENLQLTGIEPGLYTLVAAPLKLAGMDGSPVRAVLMTLDV